MRRLFGWWRLAEDAVRLLSAPRSDIAASDREIAQIVRESVLCTSVRAMHAKAARAWTNSRLMALTTRLGAELFPPAPAARVRVVGLLAIGAAVTALTLQALKPTPPGPLTWMVPAVGALAGAVVACAAAPIARALADKARRA